jgi:hypothetical protein
VKRRFLEVPDTVYHMAGESFGAGLECATGLEQFRVNLHALMSADKK